MAVFIMKKLLTSFAIAIVAVFGDRIGAHQNIRWLAAFSDNITHGVIGSLTWAGVLFGRPYNAQKFIFEVLLTGLLSSLIDIDHFITAKSFYLKDATNLPYRPFLHCTSAALLFILLLLGLGHHLVMPGLFKASCILSAAFLSHHIRDSTRRGLWMWPFGSTVPLPYPLYIALLMILPLTLSMLDFGTLSRDYSDVINI